MNEQESNIMEGYIELPAKVDLVALVKNAYKLSQPHGLGWLHAKDDDLTDDEAHALVKREDGPYRDRFPVNLDYVHGRSVKLAVTRHDGKLYVPARWYDHSQTAYWALLAAAGVDMKNIEVKEGGRY